MNDRSIIIGIFIQIKNNNYDSIYFELVERYDFG